MVLRAAAVLAAALALLCGACGDTESRAAERRVLVVSETQGFRHDSIPAARSALSALGRRDRRFDVVLLSSAAALTPARLAGADAVVFANTTGELRMSAAQRNGLLRFVRAGGGFAGFHSAADTFHDWPAYARMLGAEFRTHPPAGPGRLVVEDREHPATRGLPRLLDIREEFYAFTSDPRRRAHVLARLAATRSQGPARPLIWCRREGRGRVFYDGLGHFAETWTDPRQERLVAGGLAWVLGLARGDCG